MTRAQLQAIFPNASPGFIKANAAEASEPDGVAGLAPGERKRRSVPTLDRKPKADPRHKGSVAVVVTILSFRKFLFDSDNHIAGCKPLRDAIARSLAIDDGSERIQFQYGQQQTNAGEGTLVRIEWV